uniref:Uncharacterized protein n=1 Tax=Anguilla anguilla TaxID=7936 RepID=A0A0E9T3P4_ANGAN
MAHKQCCKVTHTDSTEHHLTELQSCTVHHGQGDKHISSPD